KKAEASSTGQKQHRNGTRGRGSRTFVSSAMVNSAQPEAASNGHHANVSSPPNVLHKPTPLRTTTNGVVATATAQAPSTPPQRGVSLCRCWSEEAHGERS
ncbi:hypothetical protein MTO96_047417, partial [Rhipicephalus appendiculatus]